jgi:hypothetical protein
MRGKGGLQMKETYTEHLGMVISLFEKQFSDIYRKAGAKRRARLLPYISTIYRRWYFSALMEETPLTPSYMVESVNLHHGKNPDAYPVLRLKTPGRYTGIVTDICDCTVEAHPIAEDLRRLVAYCSPSIDLSDDDGFWDYQAVELSERLSLQDPHYAAYLLEVSLWMELMGKIPSIYANRVQVSKEAKKRLKMSDKELFREIVEISIRMSASSLNQLIALPEPVFTDAFIRQILTVPMDTDDIFQCVYETIGFSLDDLIDADMEEEMDGLDAAFLSGTFMMGIVLDKYFFTPFSYYLRLIKPIYVLPFDFEQEISYFIEHYESDDDVSAAFFAPCSRYTFTQLGLTLFGLKPDGQNHADISHLLPFSLLYEKIMSQPEVMKALPISINQPEYSLSQVFFTGRHVYTLTVTTAADPALKLKMEVPEEFSLHRLYTEIIKRLDMVCNDEYSFFHDKVESPFTEYTSPQRAKKNKKTAETLLSEMDFTFKKHLILNIYNQDTMADAFMMPYARRLVRFDIEVKGKKEWVAGMAYPHLVTAGRRKIIKD